MSVRPVRYKYCVVPMCKSTTSKTPDKVFFSMPRDVKVRKKWCRMMKRSEKKNLKLSSTSVRHVCQDHFDLKNDMDNYMRHKLQGGNKFLKKDVIPHIFHCQRPRIPVRQTGLKRRRQELIRELLTSQPSSSRTDVVNSFDAENTPMKVVAKVNLAHQKVVAVESVQSWNDQKTKARSKWQKMRNQPKTLGDASALPSCLNTEKENTEEEKLIHLIGWVQVDGNKHIEEHGFEKLDDTPGPSQSFPMFVIKEEVVENTPEMPNSHFEDVDSSNVEDSHLQEEDSYAATIHNECGGFPVVAVKEEVPEDTPETHNSPFEDADNSEMEEDNPQATGVQPAANAQPRRTCKKRRETAVKRATTSFAHLQKQHMEATVRLQNSIEGLTRAVNLQVEAMAQVVQVLSLFLPNNIS